MKKANIILFGASGEIGNYLYRVLTKLGYSVTPVIHSSVGPILSRYKLKYLRVDLSNKDEVVKAIKGHSIVIDCTIDKTQRNSAEEMIQTNIATCKTLLSSTALVGASQYIHFSSIVVLPPRVTTEVLTQDHRSLEQDWYTQAKIATEEICQEYQESNRLLKVTIIRAGIVYGAHMGWSAVAFKRTQDSDIVIPRLRSSCLAVHPIDIARLVAKIIETANPPKIVYAINPEPVSWFNFYTAHGKAMGSKHKVIIGPALEPIKTNQLLKFWRDSLTWIKDAPIWVYLIRISWIYSLGSKIMNQQVYQYQNTETINRDVPLFPAPTEASMYSSLISAKDLETSNSIGFKYEISFSKGIQNASLWWRSKYVP